MGTAMKEMGRMRKQTSDVDRARETARAVRQQLADLGSEFEQEVERLEDAFDAQAETLQEVVVKPKSTDVHVHFVGLAWAPFQQSKSGRLSPLWG
jgi:hypothetical protein